MLLPTAIKYSSYMRYFYQVAPAAVARSNENVFTYHSDMPLKIGTLVRVSLGKNEKNGLVISRLEQAPFFKTKPIKAVLADRPLPKPLLGLTHWLSEYYATHLAVVLQTMLPSGLQKVRRDQQKASHKPTRDRTNIVLNAEQQQALEQLKSNYTTYLLHGVTGSGKTQVYIEAAKQQLSLGRSCIVLVPEISLTPQLVAEFSNHFSNLLLTHSGMGESQRHQVWLKALTAKDPQVVVGPRSALFMPLSNVGLIVIDECHEPSYKQDQSPRYSALRAASVLAKLHNAKLILGSATPSVTDYFIAETSHSPILKLTKVANNSNSAMTELIDSRQRANFTKHRFLSDSLIANIEHSLQQQKQALIFHNRRGSAPTTLCENCGWIAECPNCRLPITLHADQHQLRCHLCGYHQGVPPSCPVCREPTITFKGIGTKLIESELTKLFPKARIARFDADTATKDAAHNRYQEIYSGQIDIIIGTQMLAKGFDLPKLAVVGVVQADSGLLMPDFQAEERTFQLIYQVIGRVGRQDHPGKVVVQSFNPDHPAITAAIAKDYDSFYKAEIQRRQLLGFPPYRYLLKMQCIYKTEKGAVEASKKMAAALRRAYPELEVLGPTPAFYEFLGGKYRWQLVVKSRKRSQLVEIAKALDAPWQFDLDPSNLL